MMKSYKTLFFLLAAGLIALGLSHKVLATPMLVVTDGVSDITATIEDNGDLVITDDLGTVLYEGTDLASAEGQVAFVGSLGTWSINLTLGTTMPAAGSATEPVMTLDSLYVTSPYGGELEIMFSEVGFGSGLPGDPGDYDFTVAMGGSTDGTVEFQTFVDSGNVHFAGTTSLGPNPIIYNNETFNTVIDGGPITLGPEFSITQIATITHDPGSWSATYFGQYDVNMSMSHAPEPQTLLLLGSGLVALGITSRRRTRKNTQA